MKNNKKIPKKYVIELSNTFFKTPNFSLERPRRCTGVILWDEHTYNTKSLEILWRYCSRIAQAAGGSNLFSESKYLWQFSNTW